MGAGTSEVQRNIIARALDL
ncbi:MAG: hypothetical protein ACE5JQ_16220 [Candidatus Methylomirabilales bacterium]